MRTKFPVDISKYREQRKLTQKGREWAHQRWTDNIKRNKNATRKAWCEKGEQSFGHNEFLGTKANHHFCRRDKIEENLNLTQKFIHTIPDSVSFPSLLVVSNVADALISIGLFLFLFLFLLWPFPSTSFSLHHPQPHLSFYSLFHIFALAFTPSLAAHSFSGNIEKAENLCIHFKWCVTRFASMLLCFCC